MKSSLRQAGLTLIEVMVTIIITTVGMLGVIALQITGLQESRTSLQRTIAYTQANMMADYMQANEAAVFNGVFSNLSGNAPITALVSCTATECDQNQMALWQFARWNNDVIERLQNGQVFICEGITGFTSSGPAQCGNALSDIFTIVIYWNEGNENSTDLSCNGNPGTAQCLQYSVIFRR